MTEYLSKFQQLLRELFQFDFADLDFGIYRIMNHKRDVVERFIAKDLPKAVCDELEKDALAAQSQATRALEEARRNVLETLGEDALDAEGSLAEAYQTTKVGKEYLAAQEQAKSARSRQALEATVYNHLYTFFSRYYQDGDFISKRRYSKKERYAIPYNGEEVYLYWANHDQYYVKSGEYFTDYTWKAPNGVTVHFKLKAADVEQNNVKGEKRFFLPRLDEIAWEAGSPLPQGEGTGVRGTLVLPFEFRQLNAQEAITYGQKNQQEAIIAAALEKIPLHLPKGAPEARAALSAEKRRSENGETITYLEHHLRRYTRRNTSDFFIHKDLKGFLSRELDFYLKNEVLNLEEMEAAGEDLAEGWFQLMRLIKRVGNIIIEFLAQIEDFQKRLWEKKKFVTETFYVITVGNIAEEFYPEIAACEAQWEEWEKLLGIEIPPSPSRGESWGEGRKSRTKEERDALIKQFAREMRKAPTDAEKRLWHFLRDRRLGGFKFRRQHPVGSYIADFICIEAGVIVELDGGQHAEDDQREKDEQRTRFLESRGFRVLRFWNQDVLVRTEEVLAAILDALEMAPHPGPLPFGERGQGEGRVAFLETHPSLPLDTRHFSPDFTDRLLASFKNLDEITDGLLVHGENWQALNLLQEKYRERVKCVYIDPPFNTGKDDFTYKDGYRHSSWLSMMTDRIGSLLISILAESGVFFSSISDHELSSIRRLLDFLFGEDNLIGHIEWNATKTVTNTALISVGHIHNLVYARNIQYFVRHRQHFRLPDPLEGFENPDNDPKGPWKADPFQVGGVRPNQQYEIVNPNTGKVYRPNPGCSWKNDYDTFQKLLAEGRIVFGRTGEGGPQRKRYLFEAEERGRVATTWWDDVETTADGTRLLQDLFGSAVFTNPKPVALISRIVQLGTHEAGQVVFDHFAGSGTTGHAVINLNREDGGRRKFILVEMADYFDTVLLPRIKKVTFSPEWKDGKPIAPHPAPSPLWGEGARGEGCSPRLIKVIRLESYEDALNNLTFDEESGQPALQFEDYLLKYMLKWETRHSETLLNVEKMSKPFDYALHVYRDGETRVQKVDLPETFASLIGLDVETRRVLPSPGGRGAGGEGRYLVYRGTTREGRRTVVIWRETENWTEEDYKRDRDFVKDNNLTEGADVIYVNGDSLIPGAQALEGVFKAKMFAGVEA